MATGMMVLASGRSEAPGIRRLDSEPTDFLLCHSACETSHAAPSPACNPCCFLATHDLDLTLPCNEADDAEPIDPAQVAMGRMLDRALAASNLNADELGRDGIVVLVHLPDARWTDAAVAVWKARIRGGQYGRDKLADHNWSVDSWSSWAPKEASRSSKLENTGEEFAEAVAREQHCAAFTANVDWLPIEIIDGADFRVDLPLLVGDDVAAVAREICRGQPTLTFSDEQARAVTPRILRLARRSGQQADAYMGKILVLLANDQAASATRSTKSPRDVPTLMRLHGMQEAVSWGLAVKADLQECTKGLIPWSSLDRGCLLSGPPGCGKTLFAQAMAISCNIPLVTGSYGVWHAAGHQGDFLKAMRKTFLEAKASTPCVLFIDEVDSFPNRATLTHSQAEYMVQVVNGLLTEIDGIEGRDGVILLAACNHPDKLDPALARSGRLDRHIRVRLPDSAALVRILREHLAPDLAGVDLSFAALAAAGSSGADCERMVRGARRRARLAGRAMVIVDLVAEIMGHDSRSEAELWTAAVHEAGHALAWCVLEPGSLRSVNIRAVGDNRGVTYSGPGRSRYLSKRDVERMLLILMAGRAAEEIVIGFPSSGAGGPAGSDLALATDLALSAASALGLDERSGLVWSGVPDANKIPKALAHDRARTDSVRTALDRAYRDALLLVAQHRNGLLALADALIERRALDGHEAARIGVRGDVLTMAD